MIIYKISPRPLWEAALTSGAFAGSPLDIADGFIHFSSQAQLRETARKHFRGVPDLLLIAVSSEGFGDDLKWEPSRGGDLFPHLYGPLPVSAALWVKALPLGTDGVPRIDDALTP